MKRYKLKKDLPTFKIGDIFETAEDGGLWTLDRSSDCKGWMLVYGQKTLDKFPNILTDWFEEYEERDPLSKEALIEYLRANPEQRLMQAVSNFIYKKLGKGIKRLRAEFADNTRPDDDTWNWECDQMMLEARQQEIKEPEFTTFEEIEKCKQMKNRLREWAENNNVTQVVVCIDSDGIVRFKKWEDYCIFISIKGWPTEGLVDGAEYPIEYLLSTNKTNKE